MAGGTLLSLWQKKGVKVGPVVKEGPEECSLPVEPQKPARIEEDKNVEEISTQEKFVSTAPESQPIEAAASDRAVGEADASPLAKAQVSGAGEDGGGAVAAGVVGNSASKVFLSPATNAKRRRRLTNTAHKQSQVRKRLTD
jgi:hypothetical protein